MQIPSIFFKIIKSIKAISIFFFVCGLLSCTSSLSDEELKQKYDSAITTKNWKAASDILDVIIKRHPENKENYYSRAIAKTNINPKDPQGVVDDLSVYITYDSTSHKARYIRFQAYFILGEFDKALADINEIIKLKGKTAFLLAWKGNCAFAAKKFNIAELAYEERLRLTGQYEDLKNTYYYWVFSKYFNGNKEGALWDVAFLENRGFKEDHALMRIITDDALVFDEVANFQLPKMTLQQLEDMLSNLCSNLDIFQGKNYFRSELMEQFAHQERTEDIKTLLTQKETVYALDLSHSNLTELPKELSQFINLQALNISGNRFKNKEKLIADLSQFPNLIILVARRCNLRALPDNIALLKNLEVLSISANGLREINEHIGDLKQLKLLDIGSNSYLRDLPKSIGALRCLQRLDVSGSGMKRLREELASCSELVSISANACKIETLPERIGNLINLKHLNLAANKIKELPISIGDLSELDHLGLGNNDISTLPKEISKLKKLAFLSLAFNRFKEFPKETLDIHSLVNLWVHNNVFETIPKDVGQLESLRSLLVDHEIITDANIEAIHTLNPTLSISRNDTRKYVKGPKRKN